MMGLCHLLNTRLFSMNIASALDADKIVPYRRRIGIFTILLGVVVLAMSLVEQNGLVGGTAFTILYVVLAAIPLILMLLTNKKFSGKLILRR